MTAHNLRAGETVWLTPKTLAAPRICWKQLKAVVLADAGAAGYARIRIDNPGVPEHRSERRIHVDNLTRTDPKPPPAKTKTLPAARSIDMPDGMEEVPLW